MGERTVFQVVDSLEVGGAERIAVDLSNELSERGWRVHLFATRSTGPLETDLQGRVTVHNLARRSRWDLAGLRRFREAVRRDGPRIVHTHGWSSLQFASAGLIGLPGRHHLVFHDHRPAGLPAVSPTTRASAWPLVAAHLAVDPVLLDPPLRTRTRGIRVVVANGVPEKSFRYKRSYELGDPLRLVVLANLRPQKRHAVLFEAIEQLESEGVHVHADLVGTTSDGDYVQACKAQLSVRGLTTRVSITGPSNNVRRTLAGYDLGVLTSDTESGPIALIEYMMAGLPFVVTDVGQVTASLPASLRESCVVPIGSGSLLADGIRQIATATPERRALLAQEASRFAAAWYSMRRTADDVEAVYQELS